MSTRRDTDYSPQRSTAVYTDEFLPDYSLSPSTDHFPGSPQRDGQNDFKRTTLFSAMKDLDHDAATAFSERHDLNGYDPDHRKAVISAQAEALNNSYPFPGQDRLEASQEISAAIYRPITDRLEAQEAQGPTSWAVSTQGLAQQQDQFAGTLYNNYSDPAYVMILHDQLQHSGAYSRGEILTNEQVNFSVLKDHPDEYLRDIVVSNMVGEKLDQALIAVDRLEAAHDLRAAPAREALYGIAATYRAGLHGSLQLDEEDVYNRIIQRAEHHATEFASHIQADTGFVHKPGFHQTPLPETFRNTHQAQVYIDQVQHSLDDINSQNGDIDHVHHTVARDLANTFERTLEVAREGENSLNIREEYERMHRMAQGINFLTKPH